MGVEAVALFGHKMQPHEFPDIPTSLSNAGNKSWRFGEGPEWDFTLPAPEFWFRYDSVRIVNEDCSLNIEPCSGQVYFDQSHYGCCRRTKDREILEDTIEQVAQLFQSSSIFIVPDNGLDLSVGCYLGEHPITIVEKTISQVGAEAPDLSEIYDSEDDYRELYGVYRFPKFKPPIPSCLSGEKPHFPLTDMIESLSWDSFAYSMDQRLKVTGNIHYEEPDQPVSFWSNYNQQATVLFLGIRQMKLTSDKEGRFGILGSSEWLEAQNENVGLKHYRIKNADQTLEFLAAQHLIHLFPHTGFDWVSTRVLPGGGIL